MEYFSQFPTLRYSFDPSSGDFEVVRNIFAKTKILDEVLSNSLVYYKYSVQDGDTPESIADKYYGDSKRHWIVMFSNKILDPYFDFPLNNRDLENNIIAKYGSLANAQAHLHHVEQRIISVTNFNGNISTEYANTTLEAAYTYNFALKQVQAVTFPTINNPIIDKGTTTEVLADGTVVTRNTKWYAVNNYDYEITTNENKRQIQLLAARYAADLEVQLKSLLKQ